jgi:hypothetical protein
MVSQPNPSGASMPVQEACVRPRLGDYNVNGASIGHGPDGSQFACTIGPLPDETVTALFHAAENHGRICLLLPEPLVLDVVATERKELGRVRIVGRLVDPFSMSHW